MGSQELERLRQFMLSAMEGELERVILSDGERFGGIWAELSRNTDSSKSVFEPIKYIFIVQVIPLVTGFVLLASGPQDEQITYMGTKNAG
jgi:hypothetical protein